MKMYALHPGTLPPEDPKATERIDVSAADLARLYRLKPYEFIVWDPTDGYDYFDFIHLYPSYYGRYTRRKDGTPEPDVPCDYVFKSSPVSGVGPSSRVRRAVKSMRGPQGTR